MKFGIKFFVQFRKVGVKESRTVRNYLSPEGMVTILRLSFYLFPFLYLYLFSYLSLYLSQVLKTRRAVMEYLKLEKKDPESVSKTAKKVLGISKFNALSNK